MFIRKISWRSGIIFCVVLGLTAGMVRAEETAYLVKVEGLDRKADWQAMSESDFKALEKTLKIEKELFPKAVEMAAKDWNSDEANKNKPFLGNHLICRSILTSATFPSLDKAQTQLGKIQEQDEKKLEREKANANRSRRLPKGCRNTASSTKAQEARKKAKEEKMREAADVVKAKLDELVSKQGPQGEAGKVQSNEPKAPSDESKAKSKPSIKITGTN